MQDMKKAEEINRLADELRDLNEQYQAHKFKYYFEYDGVIQSLQTALRVMGESLCCERPAELPRNVPWCTRVSEGAGDEVAPFVFDAAMDLEDYEQMQRSIEADRQRHKEPCYGR